MSTGELKHTRSHSTLKQLLVIYQLFLFLTYVSNSLLLSYRVFES